MEQRRQERLFTFDEGIKVEEPVEMTFLEGNLYRLEATPMFVGLGAYLGDTIEVDPQEDGTLRFGRVVARSSWRHWDWLLAKSSAESLALANFKRVIEEQGGIWEHFYGGCFLVHLPEGATFDPEIEMEKWKI